VCVCVCVCVCVRWSEEFVRIESACNKKANPLEFSRVLSAATTNIGIFWHITSRGLPFSKASVQFVRDSLASHPRRRSCWLPDFPLTISISDMITCDPYLYLSWLQNDCVVQWASFVAVLSVAAVTACRSGCGRSARLD
jgi:hypothetical protein